MTEMFLPPSTNRGVNGANEKKDYLSALIDWCQITIKDVSPVTIAEEVLRIPYNLMREDKRKGIKGYRAFMCFDDIRVFAPSENTPENGYQILMSGQGCRNYEKYLETNEETWFDFLERTLSFDVNFPRIDLAIDDRKTYFKISTLQRMAKKGWTVGRASVASENGSFELKDGQRKGDTLNIGSRSSEFFMTLYEKNYEQVEKLRLSPEEANEQWNRYELKFRQKKAVAIVHELVKRREVFSVAMEYLNDSIRFVTKPKDSNDTDKRRWPLWQPWEWFMKDISKLKLTIAPRFKSYEVSYYWLSHDVAPTLWLFRKMDEEFGTNVVDEIIDNANITEKHLQLYDEFVKQFRELQKIGSSEQKGA